MKFSLSVTIGSQITTLSHFTQIIRVDRKNEKKRINKSSPSITTKQETLGIRPSRNCYRIKLFLRNTDTKFPHLPSIMTFLSQQKQQKPCKTVFSFM